ncbi:MAG: ABC transporter ATP-binding protein [Kofleriaceae bacterium]|nr:ABC transporter ATP-binding protein [Kofleriaceae bacterium]
MALEPIIILNHVQRSFGAVRALQDVTAEIGGNIIGLLGPNGAGKSTLLKCLLGLVPFEGHATVLGLSSATDGAAIRDRVGYMPEQDLLLPNMSAVELCAYAAELSGLPRTEAVQRAHAALYYAGLEEKRYQPVDTYSTGQKQRVKLAQALVHDPEILFLDEPTNGLDPKARAEMLELIAEMPERRSCTIILSTHLLGDVERVCDHAVIMHRGAVKFSGTVADLRQTRGGDSDYNVSVRDHAQDFATALANAGVTSEVTSPVALRVTVDPTQGPRQLFEIAAQTGAQLRSVEVQRETVEAAFLRIIGAANDDAAAAATQPVTP